MKFDMLNMKIKYCYIQPVPGYVTEREDHADYLILKKIYLLKIKNEQHKVNKFSINV